MAQKLKIDEVMNALFPTRTIAILMGIGFLDLLTTAILHANGLIVELNPLMKVFIERSEWAFAIVKGLTLVGAWIALAKYSKVNLEFVHKSCIVASCAYGAIWLGWFTMGALQS